MRSFTYAKKVQTWIPEKKTLTLFLSIPQELGNPPTSVGRPLFLFRIPTGLLWIQGANINFLRSWNSLRGSPHRLLHKGLISRSHRHWSTRSNRMIRQVLGGQRWQAFHYSVHSLKVRQSAVGNQFDIMISINNREVRSLYSASIVPSKLPFCAQGWVVSTCMFEFKSWDGSWSCSHIFRKQKPRQLTRHKWEKKVIKNIEYEGKKSFHPMSKLLFEDGIRLGN